MNNRTESWSLPILLTMATTVLYRTATIPRRARDRMATSALWLGFSAKERVLFAKRLSFLSKAGVPLVESLSLIHRQTSSPGKRRVYAAIIDDVSNGQYLATSLAKYQHLFGTFMVRLIRIGETSGLLTQNFVYVADELEKSQILRRKVLGALIYPAVITVATLGVTGMITVYIFPKIMPIFVSLHVVLPPTTRFLVATSIFLRSWGLVTLVSGGLLIAGLVYIRQRFETVRLSTDRALLRLPLAGSISRTYNLANTSRTLGLLLQSGLYLTDAMLVAADTTHNRVYRSACVAAARRIEHGESLSRSLQTDTNIFPDMMLHIIAIGETTGTLSSSLAYLSHVYEGELDDLTKNLSSAIEPILMVIMGLLVGLIAVSVITPIYAITQHLTPR